MKNHCAAARWIVGVLLALSAAGCEKAGGPIVEASQADATATSPKEPKDFSAAVSSPYLEAAVREVSHRDMRLVRLAGPSMCPGHFDMRPSQIRELADCDLLVRFDFQKGLDKRFGAEQGDSRRTAVVAAHGGLGVPDSYVSVCRQVADHLIQAGVLTRGEAEERLKNLADRLASLRREVERKIEEGHLRDAPVLASGHQTDFCRWLGLRVVGEISSADGNGMHDMEEALKAGQSARARIVVANEPEGRQSADVFADRLQAKVVVFANFPAPDKNASFDDMVRGNLAALLQTCHPDGSKP